MGVKYAPLAPLALCRPMYRWATVGTNADSLTARHDGENTIAGDCGTWWWWRTACPGCLGKGLRYHAQVARPLVLDPSMRPGSQSLATGHLHQWRQASRVVSVQSANRRMSSSCTYFCMSATSRSVSEPLAFVTSVLEISAATSCCSAPAC